MKKIMIATMLSAAMLFTLMPAGVSAQTLGQAESFGPMNHETGEFEYYDPGLTVPAQAGTEAGAGSDAAGKSGVSKGSSLSAKKGTSDIEESAEPIPAKYDLRDQGRVTSVKDQGQHEFCWAFSSIASLESNLITREIEDSSIDLSDGHLAYFGLNGRSNDTTSRYAGRDTCYSPDGATNFYVAGATLTRGYGAVKEELLPYDKIPYKKVDSDQYTDEPLMTTSQYEIQDIIYVSTGDTTTTSYNEQSYNAVKRLIMENGAVTSKIAFPDFSEWKEVFGTTNPTKLEAYYSTNDAADHAVTIVGWDDTFNDFKAEKRPAGPGAWILKDSYGEDLHGDGYFYASYYSPCMTQFVSFTGQKNSGREIYQYDGTGPCDNIMHTNSEVSGANCYTARDDVILDQAMVFTPVAGCDVNVKIFVTRNGDDPTGGTMVYDQPFHKNYAGYSRLDLGQKLGIPKGALFSIVITVKTPDGRYYIPFEAQDKEEPRNRPAVVRSGQSYIFLNGGWKEINNKSIFKEDEDPYRIYNALAKVYGVAGGTEGQTISSKAKLTVKKGKTKKISAKLTAGTGKLVYQTSNPKVASVTPKGVIKGKKKGTAKITIYALPDDTHKSAKRTVTVTVKK